MRFLLVFAAALAFADEAKAPVPTDAQVKQYLKLEAQYNHVLAELAQTSLAIERLEGAMCPGMVTVLDQSGDPKCQAPPPAPSAAPPPAVAAPAPATPPPTPEKK